MSLRRPRSVPAVDLGVDVGVVQLDAPVMTASGTAGHGDELAAYVDLSSIGAVVVKSLRSGRWPGNPAPRLHETPAGMLNSVGLQGPGLEAWLEEDLPRLRSRGARVVVSIWGTTVEDYAAAARLLGEESPPIEAVEVNLSCPNHHARDEVFAHDPGATREALVASRECGRPVWAKLSPNVTDLPCIAAAAHEAGAQAVTLVNTLMGMAIDVERVRPRLTGGGGLSGAAIHPVAVRAVWDVRRAIPELPIVGVGGITSGADAVEMLMAGAHAVQVGTASFADPRAVRRVQDELEDWCRSHGIRRVRELTGRAHERVQS